MAIYILRDAELQKAEPQTHHAASTMFPQFCSTDCITSPNFSLFHILHATFGQWKLVRPQGLTDLNDTKLLSLVPILKHNKLPSL